MKTILFLIVSYIWFCINTSFAQIQTLNVDDYKVYTKKANQVIDDSNLGKDPLRQWATDLATNTNGIVNTPLEDSKEAQNQTLNYIKKIVDYVLSLLAVLVLLFMLYGWILMLTAWGDDNKYKSWFERVKIGAFVIFWIWLSWLLISFIFYIVES